VEKAWQSQEWRHWEAERHSPGKLVCPPGMETEPEWTTVVGSYGEQDPQGAETSAIEM